MGQKIDQRDKSEGQMGGKGRVPLYCSVCGDKSSIGESGGKSMCKTVLNNIANSNFAYPDAFEDVMTKNIDHVATYTSWWVRC